ncbi:MAG: RHS repeat-associated core domain-containing protein, partial [Pseudomonas sp.]
DGLGRTVEEIDALGHSTGYRYDAFDRMVESTLPNEDKVKRSYADHSRAELATLLTVQPSNQSFPEINAGGQVFDGLERLTELRTGPRVETYHYKGGQLQVSERVTPRQASIYYEYALGLTQEPVTTVAPDESVSFGYDVKSARMTSSQNSLGHRTYTYDGANHLNKDEWAADGNLWTTGYVSSLQGRQLQRTDVSGLTTTYDHDRYGRVTLVSQGQLHARFEYDLLGRLSLTSSTDLKTLVTLETRLAYDEHSREILRTLSLTNQLTRTLSQSWRADDQLQCRHLKALEKSLLEEDFVYDSRGRLIQYDCSGETLPKDRYDNEIVKQVYRFDALDNVTLTLTTFADQTTDRCIFTYNIPDNPCQLLKITHSHKHYPPSTTFAYDADGNMLNDELGQRLHYDSQGRLLNVETASGDPTRQYRYDGHNHLVSTTQGAAVETLRFYEGDRLSNTVQGSTKIQYLYDGDTPLGQQQVDDDTKTLLLMTNASNSVLGESQQAKLRTAVYSAYGERSSHDDNDGELQCLLAFNGEVRDEASGWYLLGQGYRAYNPTLMRFHSPDSLSPFGAGGVNPYGYCQGNPIAFQDPTGHSVGKLEHRVFNVNKGALVTGLLLTVVFTGLAVASLGTATPFIMAVTVLGTGAMITGTGYKTAALLNHDPEEQQRLYQIGDAFDNAALLIGIGQGVGAMGKKMLKREAGGMLVDDWGKGVPDFFSSTTQGSNWTFKSRPRTSHNTRAFKPDANAGAFSGTSRSASTATSLSSTISNPVSRSPSLQSIPDMEQVIKNIKIRHAALTTPLPKLAPSPPPNYSGSYIDAARRAVANSPNDASNVRHV